MGESRADVRPLRSLWMRKFTRDRKEQSAKYLKDKS